MAGSPAALVAASPTRSASPSPPDLALSRAPPKPSPSPTLGPEARELAARLRAPLELLSGRELRAFRGQLREAEEPRVSPLRLELEGGSAAGLAALLATHYYLPAAPRVVASLLQRLGRADLLARWTGDPAGGGERAVTPRKILKRNHDCVEDDLDCYDLSGKRQAFLMCVKKHRPGAHQDVQLVREWLGQCQFEYTACIDPDKMEFLEKITLFRDELNEMKDEIGCCIVTLMSHGEKGFIKMKDGEKVSLEKIFEMFNNKNCPALQRKPKIFIVQACRGEKIDYGVETDDEPMDSDNIKEKCRLPTFSDYFIIYPTQPNHVALRHPSTGSVMIEAMVEVFKEYGNRWHIVDFFTRVNNRVVQREFRLREEPVKITLVMESTLTKSVYF